MRLATALLCATALVSASSAIAADLPTKKEPPAPTVVPQPAFSWTGFHIGVGGGGDFMQVRSRSHTHLWSSGSSTYGPYAATGDERSDLGKFGVFGAIEAGADYQKDRFVVGAFTDFNLASLKAKSASLARSWISTASTASAYHHVEYKVGDSWDAGARLGYLVTDRNLLYVLGGYSAAQISSSVRLDLYGSGTPWDSVGSSRSGWKSGYVLGGGWETALTDHITLKAEYRYADYGDAKSSYSSRSAGSNYKAWQSGDVSVHSMRVGLDYKF
jgi:outer membrane immunogenic protein